MYNLLVLDFLCVDIKALFNLLILGSSLDKRLLERLPTLVSLSLLLLERVVLMSSLVTSGKKSSSVIGFIFGWVDSLCEII